MACITPRYKWRRRIIDQLIIVILLNFIFQRDGGEGAAVGAGAGREGGGEVREWTLWPPNM